MAKDNGETTAGNEEMGFISKEYLKPFTSPLLARENSVTNNSSPHTLETSSWMQYMVVEDYSTNDPRQLCLRKDETVVVIEKSEDGEK